ncbi:MAG: redox-active disulfide protein 2 [Cytophagia bacterium]|nr:MAG: redox-active disulfide protein 2 [Runella sp.]TAG17560.1 MAG: redox-active disulfide protein 2 [Cytophagales bacterium]TAG37976.1 MAG: redox-active disulfide protein 2 [Cytophagia bacterium]TAG78124.1 MAG: redox-active disulfide protein 2 [Cytophagales bacterium]
MKENSYAKMSDETLKKNIKTTTFVAGLLGGALFVLFCIKIYNYVQEGLSVGLITPIALLPILLLNINNINKMKAELKSRDGNPLP